MTLTFSSKAWDNYSYWQKTEKAILKRINTLIKDIQRDPFEGIGKPEPLKHSLSGYWSRRINARHLLESIAELEDGKGIERELIE